MVEEYKLENVTLLPMQPSSLATSIYSSASVNLIPLVSGGVRTALPSKTGVVLSCGKPTIFCFGNSCEFASVLCDYEGVENVDSNDEDELVSLIMRLYQDKVKTAQGAKELFKTNFTRSKNVQRYIGCLEKI